MDKKKIIELIKTSEELTASATVGVRNRKHSLSFHICALGVSVEFYNDEGRTVKFTIEGYRVTRALWKRWKQLKNKEKDEYRRKEKERWNKEEEEKRIAKELLENKISQISIDKKEHLSGSISIHKDESGKMSLN